MLQTSPESLSESWGPPSLSLASPFHLIGPMTLEHPFRFSDTVVTFGDEWNSLRPRQICGSAVVFVDMASKFNPVLELSFTCEPTLYYRTLL